MIKLDSFLVCNHPDDATINNTENNNLASLILEN